MGSLAASRYRCNPRHIWLSIVACGWIRTRCCRRGQRALCARGTCLAILVSASVLPESLWAWRSTPPVTHSMTSRRPCWIGSRDPLALPDFCCPLRALPVDAVDTAAFLALLPQVAGCAGHVSLREHRYKVYYTAHDVRAYKSRAFSYGHREAIRFCVEWCWTKHIAAVPEAVCPWDLTAAP